MNSRQSWNDDISGARVTIEGQLCGTITTSPASGEWLEVTCNLTGNNIMIELVEFGYLTFCGIEVEGTPSSVDLVEDPEVRLVDAEGSSEWGRYVAENPILYTPDSSIEGNYYDHYPSSCFDTSSELAWW